MTLDSNEINIRDCSPEDEDALAVLLFANFPNALDPSAIHKTWLWQFRNRFSKKSGVAVAQKGNNLVAQYAVMWFPMIYKHSLIQGAISTATVTDRSVRKQGLFTKLAKKVYQDIAADGAKIVFGFPNSQSVQGFIKNLDWFKVAAFPAYIKLIDFSVFAKKAIGNNTLASLLGSVGNFFIRLITRIFQSRNRQTIINVKQTDEIPDGIGDLWKTTAIAGKIALIRNREYLSWRYLEKPFFSYEIYIAFSENEHPCGYVITNTIEKFGMKILFVMEFIAENDNQAIYKVLLEALDNIAQEKGLSAISTLIPPGHPSRLAHLRKRFIPIPHFLFPQDVFWGARANSPDIERDYIHDKKNWYISWGDLDVV
jgi:hypothetical protein